MKRIYGRIPDAPDDRDLKLKIARLPAAQVALPPLVDLTPEMPPVWDQGQIGSCTGHGCGAAVEFDRSLQKLTEWTPSRLLLYYDGRIPEKATGRDAGASIRDVLKGLNNYGYCAETLWPYDEKKVCVKPTIAAYADAAAREQVIYQSVTQPTASKTLVAVQTALASALPVIMGTLVYDSFEGDAVAKTGIVPMPTPKERKSPLCGHCMLVVGYDTARQQFIVRNSWGMSWGHAGYCRMPFAYLTTAMITSDLWTISHLSN
jgi:C1A family cysteine protease